MEINSEEYYTELTNMNDDLLFVPSDFCMVFQRNPSSNYHSDWILTDTIDHIAEPVAFAVLELACEMRAIREILKEMLLIQKTLAINSRGLAKEEVNVK